MQDKLGKTPEILFEPKINSLKFKEITSGCYMGALIKGAIADHRGGGAYDEDARFGS
jgi:hypothetical protein